MISVVCCDDNLIHLKMLRQELSSLEVGERICASYFSSSEEFIRYIDHYGKNVDVVVCEVALGNENSIRLIGQIKERYAHIQVVFMSAFAALCEDTYDVEHIYFLNKPVRGEALGNAIRLAAQRAKRGTAQVISIRNRGCIKTLRMSEILYIEAMLREVRIVAESESISAYNRLCDMLRQLDNRFFYCHKSYIVNMDKVEDMDSLQFTLSHTIRVPIALGRYDEARRRYQGLQV